MPEAGTLVPLSLDVRAAPPPPERPYRNLASQTPPQVSADCQLAPLWVAGNVANVTYQLTHHTAYVWSRRGRARVLSALCLCMD